MYRWDVSKRKYMYLLSSRNIYIICWIDIVYVLFCKHIHILHWFNIMYDMSDKHV